MDTLESVSRETLIQLVLSLQAQVAELEAELACLKNPPKSSPPNDGPPAPGIARTVTVPVFVKANRPPREKKERKKRGQSSVRKCGEPTEVVVHRLHECPDCGHRLGGGTLHRSREVIDIPQIIFRIIKHEFMAHTCGVCKKRHIANPDLSGEVLGKRRFSSRIISLVTYLSTESRLTKEKIRSVLQSFCGLKISVGEIMDMLHATANKGKKRLENILEGIRKSSYVHADETGWREDGVNGYAWSFSTPTLRFYFRDKSRGHQVPENILGADYRGVIISDFYCGYSYHIGRHQRCWVHFLRDLKELEEKHPKDKKLERWIATIRTLYNKAKHFRSEREHSRVSARRRFENALLRIGEKYHKIEVPQRILAARCVKFAGELFTFIEHPGMPSENNPAERAIRTIVIARKISGGTRSPLGSATRMALASMFETWKLNGIDPYEACHQLLSSTTA